MSISALRLIVAELDPVDFIFTLLFFVRILNQNRLIEYAYISVKRPFLEVSLYLRIIYAELPFCYSHLFLPNPTFVPSLSEIGDWSCIISCLVFAWDTLLKSWFKTTPSTFQEVHFDGSLYTLYTV